MRPASLDISSLATRMGWCLSVLVTWFENRRFVMPLMVKRASVRLVTGVLTLGTVIVTSGSSVTWMLKPV